MAFRIEDYALLGDCYSAALVGKDGSIDWLCWPRFDSDACFAALLGAPDNGRWLLAPVDATARVSRRYREDTLILETRFETDDAAVVVIDFMPPHGDPPDLIRIVVGERGSMPMRTELVVRYGYGATVPWCSKLDPHTLMAVSGPDMLVLRSPVALRGENLRSVAEFSVSAGERQPFVLGYGPSHLAPPAPADAERELERTERFWTEWSSAHHDAGEWAPEVARSLVTLKALTYAPTGGIVAAPTTSLPEQLGSSRNWDYRFCWLRDATLTLLALMNAGHYEEAKAWRDWLVRAAAGAPEQMQILYGIAGEHRATEWEVPWLCGHEASRPVRIGNAACEQLQLDVFGEVMDALHQARCGGLAASDSAWALQQALLDHLERIWQEPDEGIWEVRGPRQHFTFSKAMAWVAFDRAVKGVEQFGLPGPAERWRSLRDRIHEDVCLHGFDAELGSFVQAYGSRLLDASLLLLPTIGFLPVSDARIAGTIAAIERRLLVDGLVLRYDTVQTDDGLPAGEGAFLACSFWLADAYTLMGRLEDARRLFQRLLALRNDVGLLAEEYDPRAGRQLGNFPQAFSHVSLLNTAHNLSRADKPAQQRSTGLHRRR
ncbi:glucoamylase [Variovorax sp. WS11]|uniref:glycoside hydrolase family 15 protein n=1 Tax=Variovorax sp. WS11 TaxID=1105204 RepID=UPI000D0D5FA0|nr:glycoside hydrolase family 15 protein [Variovorax sp. WS11]NDZ18569.1 glycoside hydrolase family 15 protein [Variovorax sp. WS11]PSL85199.1 glucoamylase [Variovorax sp. WS11]